MSSVLSGKHVNPTVKRSYLLPPALVFGALGSFLDGGTFPLGFRIAVKCVYLAIFLDSSSLSPTVSIIVMLYSSVRELLSFSL